ncbi:MAG: deoxyribodipyrimidine photo-lyase, partial [Gammaproteobacteria bacterium]|nr:deoxyribodipyrimidine photo-lyase [Gammaproteobacteria bacterium]
GWQWTAGCGADAAPYFRVFSPARQAERFDPDGAYIKRWVPQLAQADRRRLLHGVEQADIHTGYPPPMVDIAASRQAALARWDAIKTMPREAS